jgi:hypothetical protein
VKFLSESNGIGIYQTMSHAKARTPSKSSPDGVIELALRSARDEFERTLNVEWNAKTDSAHILNAMTAQRIRCRHCQKPFAGSGNLCDCRTKIDLVRCISNPQDALRGLLHQRCGDIATSASLATFIRIVANIAVAHDHDLDWVERQMQELLPTLKRAGRKWVIGISPLPFRYTGVLPAWVRDSRTEIPQEDLYQGLSSEDTEAELEAIEAEIERCFDKAKKAALAHANLQMAQVARLAPKSVPRRRARQDILAAVIASIKRGNPRASIEQICLILDDKGFPLRDSDKLAGFSTWHDAWADKDQRPPIKRFISGIPPAAPVKKI